ncbi:hypothetical protein EBB59_13260, partial [Lysobacter pythonis]
IRNGLGIRSFNLMTDYHNRLLGDSILPRLHEPEDPRMNVIHRSEEGNLLFRTAPKMERALPAGQVRQLASDYSGHTSPSL